MDIWNVYISERKHKKKMENIKNNNNILNKSDINLTTKLELMFWKLRRQKKINYHKLSETYHEKQ